MAADDSPKFKVVFVGDTKVGKTSLIQSHLKLSINVSSTLGATSTRIEVDLEDSTAVLMVWDTAGQESLRSLVPVYAKGSQAAVIVFDQSEPSSYGNVPGWYDYLTQNVGEIPIVLAANKSDLPAKVDFNDVFQWAGDHGMDVVRTSAMEGTNVSALFESVAQKLVQASPQKKVEQPVPPPVELLETPRKEAPEKEQRSKKNRCC
jgi:small GTP-binding protein